MLSANLPFTRCGKLWPDDTDASTGSTASRSPKRRRRRRHLDPSAAEEASSVTSAASTSSTKSCRVEPLIMCRRNDCPKAYHLQCLELEKKPVGTFA
ncbi:unnamed protein product [Dibothriocephalus latus]|uniref:Uncharacterized protein n=1 Tax=Dibothriocephalus latus TaxID=60516 RepID=A0A3P6R5H2_DIBLA|nr:unnamed protein product [Dibothriocephalus latus]